MSKENVLVGRRVVGISLAEDKMAIRFDLASGESVVARCDADCCSHTWIENLENPETILDSEVLAVENVEMPEDEQREDGDVVQFYGLKIKTTRGECFLDYRNESNGYYGGNLVWGDAEYFYGGVYGQNVSKLVWKQVAPTTSASTKV